MFFFVVSTRQANIFLVRNENKTPTSLTECKETKKNRCNDCNYKIKNGIKGKIIVNTNILASIL